MNADEATALAQPQALAIATRQLKEARDLPEVTKVMREAEMLRAWARQAEFSRDVQNDWAALKLDAERKAGDMLTKMELNNGRPKEKVSLTGTVPVRDTFSPRLADLGLNRKQSSTWQRIAKIPTPTYEAYKTEAQESGKEITESGALRIAAEIEREERRSELAGLSQTIVLSGDKRYAVLYADPPWRYDFSETETRRIENHYPTMENDEIAQLAVPAADDAILFMWATNPKLREAFAVLDGWGFEYVTNMVWIKDRIGMGYYARSRHELLLIAKRGSLPKPEPASRPDSVIEAPREEHSAKPPLVYDLIDAMYPGFAKIELFARSQRNGWDAWGNEVAS
jgi:N6-adenosine-specific RNA methylase IME4